ncbi:MAG: hypothetical protein JRN20_18930 [Nitrososphaerota archaeon]|jgi:hypothetical protein|nr:hypothetical protein [Nitrososphaerota archaeon]MDG6922929.1 hypothetical protein [Nitrososphaerota archaeon]
MSIALSGNANVKVALRSTGGMNPEDILKFHPEIQVQLDEIVKQGWSYLYIQTIATTLAEVNAENTSYKIAPSLGLFSAITHGAPENVLELDIGTNMPAITGIPEVNEFRINICSNSLPRAATVDLAAGLISYIHDPFWKWQNGWEKDEKKLSDAKEVYNIISWLLEKKKYKLREDLDFARYLELSQIFVSLSLEGKDKAKEPEASP